MGFTGFCLCVYTAFPCYGIRGSIGKEILFFVVAKVLPFVPERNLCETDVKTSCFCGMSFVLPAAKRGIYWRQALLMDDSFLPFTFDIARDV